MAPKKTYICKCRLQANILTVVFDEMDAYDGVVDFIIKHDNDDMVRRLGKLMEIKNLNNGHEFPDIYIEFNMETSNRQIQDNKIKINNIIVPGKYKNIISGNDNILNLKFIDDFSLRIALLKSYVKYKYEFR